MTETTEKRAATQRERPTPRHERRTGRRAIVSALVIIGWLLIAGALASQSGKLADVVESGAAGYLPTDSQAKEVFDATEKFGDEYASPAIVVWSSDGALSGRQRDAIRTSVGGVRDTFGSQLASGGVQGPVWSKDGSTAQAIVMFAGSNPDDSTDAVEDLRADLEAPAGTRVQVTGPAGTVADMQEALGAVDIMLVAVTCTVILIILLITYRSLLLPFLVIAIGGLALGASLGALYLLVKADVLAMGAEVQGITSVLVLGCATDYAMLMIARFRDGLADGLDKGEAARFAVHRTVEPILASGGTVILGLLCLTLSGLGMNRELGPAAAIGVLFALVAMLTMLPAVLALIGRTALWPLRRLSRGSRGRMAWNVRLIKRHPRRVWMLTTAALLVAGVGAVGLNAGGLTEGDMVIGSSVESRDGQEQLDLAFPGSAGSPTIVLVDRDQADRAAELISDTPGVESVEPWVLPGSEPPTEPVVDGRVRLDASLTHSPESSEALDTVEVLRDRLDALPVSERTLIGGQAAIRLDFNQTAADDRWVLGLLLVVVLVVVCLLLRSVVAGVLIVTSVAVSFMAALGIATVAFQDIFGFPGVDATFPIHACVFLVALGVDYSIFLMSRVREEVKLNGPISGVLTGLTATAPVITGAGLVLAATFAALALVPLVLMVQLAFIVSVGVLLDTFIVRSLLVPALALDLGRWTWWPSRLARSSHSEAVSEQP